jgi:PAS domain S-box-containing protein
VPLRLVLLAGAGLLIGTYALVFGIEMINHFRIIEVARQTRTQVLPNIAKQNDAARDAERLLQFGQEIVGSRDPQVRRNARLSAQLLAYDESFHLAPQVSAEVLAALRGMVDLANRRDQRDQDIAKSWKLLLVFQNDLRSLTAHGSLPATEGDVTPLLIDLVIAGASDTVNQTAKAIRDRLGHNADRSLTDDLDALVASRLEVIALEQSIAADWADISRKLRGITDTLAVQAELATNESFFEIETHAGYARLVTSVGIALLAALLLSMIVCVRRYILVPLAAATGALEAAGREQPVPPALAPRIEEIGAILDAARQLVAKTEALRESESKYRLLIEHQTALVIKLDTQNRLQYVSPSFCKTFGKEERELIGTDFIQYVHGEDIPGTLESLSVLRRPPLPANTPNMRVRLLTTEGLRWFSWTNTAIVEQDGNTPDIMSVGRDITERKRAEDALLASREQLRQVINLVPHFVFAKDLDGRFVLANKALAEAYGTTVENLIGKTDLDFAASEDEVHRFREWDLKVIESGETSVIADECITDAAGNVRHLSTVKVPFVFSGTNRPAVLGVSVDITEQLKMQEVMIQTEKMMSVGGLAAGMAHEINNPLSGILQSIQVVKRRTFADSPANEAAAKESGCSLENIRSYLTKRGILEMCDLINDSTVRAARIVREMLDFSRKSESSHAPADVHDMLDTSVKLSGADYDLKKKYDFRNIIIERDYDQQLPQVPCTKTRIEQVFMNILHNAAHALAERSPGSSPPKITLRTRREESMARIEIEDNGPGMDDQTRRKIFEPFFTTKAEGEGTGLGMSVSYFIIVNNHNGTIEVESSPGNGAKFIIRLPLLSIPEVD